MSANPPMPGIPAPTPATPAPAAAPAVPQAVQRAADTAIVTAMVNGKSMDVTVADMRKTFQIGNAAEQKLAAAGQVYNQHRADIDFAQRLRTLGASNPQAALEEVHKTLGLRLPPKASEQPSGDFEPDARYQQLQAELDSLKARQSEHDQFREQAVYQSVTQQIDSALAKMPLYAADAERRNDARDFVAAVLRANPTLTLQEVVGQVHERDAGFVQRQLQSEYNTRSGNATTLASVPPGSGTPIMAQLPSAKMTPEEMRSKSTKGPLMAYIQRARKAIGD